MKLKEQILNTAAAYIKDVLRLTEEKPTRDTKFTEDLGMDSLEAIELVMKMEEEFQVTIDENEFQKMETVGEACDRLEEILSKKDVISKPS